MSLREDMWKYEQITGESAEHVPIIKLGAFLDGYDMGIKALEQQPRWIPVYEKLPKQEGWYLISLGGKTYGGADVDMYCKGWVKYGTHVLAWMPLPEPYEESRQV